MAGNVIIVSTETERGKRELRAATVVCWIGGILFILAALFFWFAPDDFFYPSGDLTTRLSFVLLFLVMAVLPAMPRFIVRGNWRLDDDGIAFSPLREKDQSLAWREVKTIVTAAMRHKIVFCDGTTKLPLVLQWETCKRQEETLDFLREKLRESFDVFDRPAASRTSVRRLLLASAVATFVTLLYFGALIIPAYYLQYEHWQLWTMAWMPLPFCVLFPWAVIVVRRERRKMWSWRKLPLPPTME